MKKEQNKDYKKNKIDLIKKEFKENKQKEKIFIDFILKSMKYTFSQKEQMLKILENENDKNFFIDDIFKQSSNKHIEFYFDSFVPLKTLNKDRENKINLIRKAFKEDKETEEAFIDTILNHIYEEDLEEIDLYKKFISQHEIYKEKFFNDTFNKQNDKAIEKYYKTLITSKQEEEKENNKETKIDFIKKAFKKDVFLKEIFIEKFKNILNFNSSFYNELKMDMFLKNIREDIKLEEFFIDDALRNLLDDETFNSIFNLAVESQQQEKNTNENYFKEEMFKTLKFKEDIRKYVLNFIENKSLLKENLEKNNLFICFNKNINEFRDFT